ncbi:hypothetical protein HPP92_018696 [Vanilla planifolia]|uniref:Uncharacterized protein n=1 Tax=Vanilla planifolia TaxID=51239 RepID=A0A835QAC8_VANPL|nr:hypothetical protein HPP92_018696 [Vanilla planifolia]
MVRARRGVPLRKGKGRQTKLRDRERRQALMSTVSADVLEGEKVGAGALGVGTGIEYFQVLNAPLFSLDCTLLDDTLRDAMQCSRE